MIRDLLCSLVCICNFILLKIDKLLKYIIWKKTLLFAALLIGGLSQLSAQCFIGAACTPSAQGYCTVPAENTNLPNGTTNVAYSTDIQFTLGTNVGGFATITDAAISTVVGLPSGFAPATTNPTNGTFLGGSSACMQISGTTSTPGTYSIAATFAVNTSFQSYNKVSNVLVSPNPATNELFVASASHFGKVVIIDALGKTVLSHDANYAAQTTINISSLSKGVYFLQVSDGANLTTKKFIKD